MILQFSDSMKLCIFVNVLEWVRCAWGSDSCGGRVGTEQKTTHFGIGSCESSGPLTKEIQITWVSKKSAQGRSSSILNKLIFCAFVWRYETVVSYAHSTLLINWVSLSATQPWRKLLSHWTEWLNPISPTVSNYLAFLLHFPFGFKQNFKQKAVTYFQSAF